MSTAPPKDVDGTKCKSIQICTQFAYLLLEELALNLVFSRNCVQCLDKVTSVRIYNIIQT